MKYYVFHNDQYADNGGVGMESFDSPEAASQYIQGRLRQMTAEDDSSHPPDLSNYTVIEGVELKVTAVEVVTRIKIGV